MAALVDGQRYGLSSHGQNIENRTLVFVKLTDSALRSIDEYLSNQASTNRQPTIQFQENQGVITFPSSYNVGEEQVFNFTCSSSSDSEGLQCIMQTGSRSLESVGNMQYKMHIQAKEESFQTTKNKMAAAEEESKKNCTKVIKVANPRGVMRKVKTVVKHPTAIPPPRPPSSSPPYSSLSKSSNCLLNKSNGNNGHHGNSINTNSSSSVNSGVSYYANKNNLVNHNKHVGNPEIMRRPFRERIVQFLALRSCKKPELMHRLNKDGIKEKDKKTLTNVLSLVANMKGNTFELARHIWNEVQEDWPFYTEAEKEEVKKRKHMLGTAEPERSPSSNSVSLHSSPPQKRPLNNSPQNMPTAKKQRISHYVKQPETTNGMSKQYEPVQTHKEPSGNSQEINFTHNNFSASGMKLDSSGLSNGYGRMDSTGFLPSGHHGYGMKEKIESNGYSGGNGGKQHHSTGKSNGYTGDYNRLCKGQKSNTNSSALCNGSTGGSHQSTPSSSPDSQDNLDTGGSSSQHSNDSSNLSVDLPDQLKKYTVITTPEQRAHYKADFNAEYDEYRKLHAIIERVSKKFAVLEQRLSNSDEGSEECMRIKDQILKEYKENKQNFQYQEAKKRFNYLHQKLSHIKKLVIGYDNNHMCDS